MADWASLLPELVQGIADSVLSSMDGGNVYIDMRAVCSSWRSALVKPSPLDAVTDLRLRPRHWVMLDFKSWNRDDDVRLFLHVLTGQFRRLRLPVVHDHIIVGASDGLLVFINRDGFPHLGGVLNPLTGDMIPFAASLYKHFVIWSTAVTGGSHSRLVLKGSDMVAWATPTSDEFTEEEIGKSTINMGTFQGNVFVVDVETRVFKLVTTAERCDDGIMLIAELPPEFEDYSSAEQDDGIVESAEEENYMIGLSYHLVESAGDLLVIRNDDQAVKVFRVDVERKLLEEVKSLGGGRALFVGPERCMSVYADNLPSVEGDCIYLFNWARNSKGMFVYNLRDRTMETISSMDHLDRPFSLVQVLAQYCDF